MQFVGALVRCVPSLHAALAEFRHEPARAAQQAYGVAHVRPVPSVSLWKLESTRLILRKVGLDEVLDATGRMLYHLDCAVCVPACRPVVEDKHIKGRRGLHPGDFGLETTGHVSRLELFTIYAGVYMTQEEALTDKATRNVQFATTLVSASDVITEDIYVYINPARSTLKAEHGNVGLFANDVSMDLKDEHGERNVGAFEPTCEFVPFTFFYFPMVAMFAKSGLGNKQEIAGDYGDDFKI